MRIQLTKAEIENIHNNNELIGRMVLTDWIAVEFPGQSEPVFLWRRPLEELAARGLPMTVQAMLFSVDGIEEADLLNRAVKRLKYGG
jgi:hypothetical protein